MSAPPVSRRKVLATFGGMLAGLAALPLAKWIKGKFVKRIAPSGYDPYDHKWLMCIDVDKCIGCGLCADACKKENHVPEASHYFRTWIERYIIKKPESGELTSRGEVLVDSPNGGRGGFPPTTVPKEDILKSFFVPKLCNLCVDSPCTQVCPVGATFDAPDGAVLVDPTYCIGCGFCIQACPYGCRFFTPETPETKADGTAGTAQKCTLCYHRITRGLQPACVEICPTQARVFGDLKHPVENDPLQAFVQNNKVNTLKPHLGTNPRLLYANIDKEVR
ncbi:MAG: 4Fe-4S dicluster domain-containing protein [Akkermansiaceae bacterium]|nr:4Fe-4S dicluster domain-containing protein [Akkermansiaceae bacterium]MCF7733020.1 4Fe-4S dicluster domain-containing protein [Akkermansiaceae bacterium]